MKKLMKLMALCLFALAALTLAACNTVEGIGEDLSAGGDALSDAADGDDSGGDQD